MLSSFTTQGPGSILPKILEASFKCNQKGLNDRNRMKQLSLYHKKSCPDPIFFLDIGPISVKNK